MRVDGQTKWLSGWVVGGESDYIATLWPRIYKVEAGLSSVEFVSCGNIGKKQKKSIGCQITTNTF